MAMPGHTLHESVEMFCSKTTLMSYHGQQIGRYIYIYSPQNTNVYDVIISALAYKMFQYSKVKIIYIYIVIPSTAENSKTHKTKSVMISVD